MTTMSHTFKTAYEKLLLPFEEVRGVLGLKRADSHQKLAKECLCSESMLHHVGNRSSKTVGTVML